MSKPFEIAREFEVESTPQEVFAAITTGAAGWLWPSEYEPQVGGAAPFGATITAWDPPHRLTARAEMPDGVHGQTLNQLDHLIEPREGGGSWVRYVHSGIFVDDWDNQYDGANRHTDFYLHTLGQYLKHFSGRPAAYASVNGPAAAGTPDALELAWQALGLPADAAKGATVDAALPGSGQVTAVVDFRDQYFFGLRTGDAMYRFFGRNHWGATVGVAVHDFAPGADGERIGADWTAWLGRVYG